jgi:hypothetical protein
MSNRRENEGPMPEPIAYFLTWATYGTWLPGDERGWVEYKKGCQAPDPVVKRIAAAALNEEPCLLDREQRDVVEQTVRDHCRIRRWTLHAVNSRTTHLHVVVTADQHPDDVREQLKAWCTRKLKELEAERMRTNPTRQRGRLRDAWWAERGSKRYINDEEGLEAAIVYVRDGQDRKGDVD